MNSLSSEVWRQYVFKAYEIAVTVHEGQLDKGGLPYVLHPLAVAYMAFGESGYYEDYAVGLLHDVVEDTTTTFADLEDLFPPMIVDAIDYLTRREGEPYSEYIQRVKQNEIARRVKIQDLKHNSDTGRLPQPLTEKDEARLVKYANALSELEY